MKGKLTIAVLLFVFGTFIGCRTTGKTQGRELWTAVQTVRELVGKWNGSVKVYIPEDRELDLPESSIVVSIGLEYKEGAEYVNSSMNIDIGQFLTDRLNIGEIGEGEYTKDEILDTLMEEFSKTNDVTVGGKYYLTADLSDIATRFINPESGAKIFIDQKRTSIKIVFDQPLSFDLGDSGVTEIILPLYL
jgi:hypothetical protein